MKLGLCSGAAPDASIDDLIEAAQRRGITAIELREGDAHGVDPSAPLVAAVATEKVAVAGMEITGFRVVSRRDPRRLARLSELLRAPILVDGPERDATRLERALDIGAEGSPVALVVRPESIGSDAQAAAEAGFAIAWNAHPHRESPGATVAALLADHPRTLGHVRLHGGGPESSLHEGKGVGEMTARLALAGYTGTVILTPTSQRFRVAWQHWLGRRGGWGCGSKSADPELVTLNGPES